MATTSATAELPPTDLALSWLRSAKDALAAARDAAHAPRPTGADWLLDDPSNATRLLKEVTIEAIRRDAPDGVVDGLLIFTRRVSAGAARLKQNTYLSSALASLKGKTEPAEIQEVLERALTTPSPDQTGTEALRAMLAAVVRMRATDVVFFADELVFKPETGVDPGTSLATHIPCLGVFCALCIEGGPLGCVACAVIGQAICLL